MPNLTSVTVTSGVPTSGSGTVSTIDALMADGGQATLGAKADAANTATDTTAVSGISIWKQISASIQTLAGAVGSSKLATKSASGDFADGAIATIGAKADAKSTATDTTSVSAMQVWKQISASVQLMVFGGGTQAAAQRVTMATDSPGIIATGSQASPSASYLSSVVAGDIAAAASDSGNPLKIGGVGKTANPTAVTDGQRVNAIFDKLGKQIVVGAIRDLKGNQQTQISASTSETTIVTAVAATFLDLYGLILANTGVSNTKVSIRDDTAGTVRAIIYVPAGETRGFMLPVDSGMAQTAVNKNWTAQCSVATTALEVTALYVKNI